MKKLRHVAPAAVLGVLAVIALITAAALRPTPTVVKTRTVTVRVPVTKAETVYIRNLAQQYISDAQIRNDIPAWEKAINVDFAKYWYTTQYKLVFIGRKPAPTGAISAEFVNKGPVKGALAYHTENRNAPSITVYAGTDDYYGYSNSVSFTHELEELAADPITSYLNVGYPSGYYWLQDKAGNLKVSFNDALGWFSEVSDPVEADSYTIPGANGKSVQISDFVTPAWFNDGVGGRYDFMGLCQQPLWIRPGGYAQFINQYGWQIVENFRSGHPADSGFLKGERGNH